MMYNTIEIQNHPYRWTGYLKWTMSAILVVALLLTSMLQVAPVFGASGDFSLDFRAAAPFTYNHKTGGGAWNDGTNSETGDTREELQGGQFACGDIVTYLQEIVVDPGTADVGQVLELDYAFLADTTGQSGAAHTDVVNVAVNYGQVENGDDGTGTNPGVGGFGLDSGINDDRQTVAGGDTGIGGSTATIVNEAFDPPGSEPFDPNDPAANLLLTIRVDGLDPGETIIVRIDVRIECDPGSRPTGNLQAKLDEARLVEANGLPTGPDAVPGGAQTIPFKQIGNLDGVGEPLVRIFKTVGTECGVDDAESILVAPGATVVYCYIITNPGTDTLYNVDAGDDLGTPDDSQDDQILFLVGLTDEDGDGNDDDLVAGGEATATLTSNFGERFNPGDPGYCPAEWINTVTAVGTVDSDIQSTRLVDTDTATVKCDPNLAVTVGYINASRTGGQVDFSWQTVTETGTAGFNIVADGAPLNAELIPSTVVDSVVPTDYSFSAVTDADVYYLEEVSVDGKISQMGPYEVGVEYGGYISTDAVVPAIYLPLMQR